MSKTTKTTGRNTKWVKRTKKIIPSYGEFLADGEKELDYIDTEGHELSDPNPKLTAKKQAAKDKKEVAKIKATKKVAKVRTPKAPSNYAGAAIPATKVWYRKMEEFKNCVAHCWMLENDIAGTTTFANTYNDQLKASYDPKTYTYATNDKKLATRAEQMIEMTNPAEWPTWIINAHGTKTEKTKARKTK